MYDKTPIELHEHTDCDLTLMIQMILNVTVWNDRDINTEHRSKIANGLILLAKSGNNLAAALYCISAAYGSHNEYFSNSTAISLLFSAGEPAIQIYHNILRDEFLEIVDEEFFEYMWSYPAIQYFYEKDNISNPLPSDIII